MNLKEIEFTEIEECEHDDLECGHCIDCGEYIESTAEDSLNQER